MKDRSKGKTDIKRIFSVFRDQPIRRKIVVTFLVSCIIIASTVLFLANIVSNTMQTIGSSYQSNADLDRYLTQLSDMEAAMEMYIQYRTFESVDRYYHYLAIVESSAENLFSSPSEIQALQREYNIRQLSENFCQYSGLAVAARRANNSANLDDRRKLREESGTYADIDADIACPYVRSVLYSRNVPVHQHKADYSPFKEHIGRGAACS